LSIASYLRPCRMIQWRDRLIRREKRVAVIERDIRVDPAQVKVAQASRLSSSNVLNEAEVSCTTETADIEATLLLVNRVDVVSAFVQKDRRVLVIIILSDLGGLRGLCFFTAIKDQGQSLIVTPLSLIIRF